MTLLLSEINRSAGCPSPGGTGVSNVQGKHPREGTMLRWALAFFIVAIVAALFGFGGIAVASAGIAKILFLIFLIGFLVTLVLGLVAGRRVPPI